MRPSILLLLSMVSLFADAVGPNATKIPPVRRNATVHTLKPPAKAGTNATAMKMPATKQAAKKGNTKTPSQKSGAISSALSGKAGKTGTKAALPPRLK